MRILGLYLNDFVRTGGQRRYLELLEGLAAKGHEVLVLMDEDLVYTPLHLHALPIRVRDKGRRRLLPNSLNYLRAVASSFPGLEQVIGRIDYIHIHGELHYLAAMHLKRRLGARLFFAYRSNAILRDRIGVEAGYVDLLGRLKVAIQGQKYRLYERLIARKAEIIAFQNSSDEEDFLSRAPAGRGKTVIIRGAIDGPRFRKEHEGINRATRVCKLVYVGLLHESKGVMYLLDAMAELHRRGIDSLSLDVLGRGESLEARRAYCEERGIGQMVSFCGQVADPFPYLADADLMVFPSLYDAYPDVILESLFVGLPVIATKVGGLGEMLAHEELLVPVMDSAAIADRVERCVREPAFYQRLRALCAERKAHFVFDWAEAWERVMKAGLAP